MAPTIRFLAAAALATLAALPALARNITPEDRTAIAERIDAPGAAMTEGDWAALSDSVPPRIREQLATANGMSVDQLRDAMASAMTSIMQAATVEDFGMSLETAEEHQTADGTPYLLIPTFTIIATEGNPRIRVDSQTVALEDGGGWYLVRTDDAAQTAKVKDLFPAFATVAFPKGTMTPLD